MRKTLGDKKIDFQQLGGNELYFNPIDKLTDQINHYNKLLKSIFKKVYSLKNDFIENFGLSKEHIKNLVHTPFEGQINSGKTIYFLQRKIMELGAKIYTNTHVEKIICEPKKKIRLLLKIIKEKFIFESNFLAICTNAFAKNWFPKEDINPGRGMVLVTRPIKI